MPELSLKSEGILTYSFPCRRPLVYLDNCGLILLEKDISLLADLVSAVAKNGTLAVSIMNLVEFSASSPDSLMKIKNVIAGVGQHWIPIESTPGAVSDRELCPGENEVWFDISFLKEFRHFIDATTMSIAPIFDAVAEKEYQDSITPRRIAVSDDIVRFLTKARAQWKANPRLQGKAFDVSAVANNRRAYITNGKILELICKQDFPITRNHAMDYFHSVVPLAYCDYIVLDGHWASIGTQCHLSWNPRIYRPTEVRELIQAIGDYQDHAE